MAEILNHYHIVFDNPIFWLYIAAVFVDIILGNVKAFRNNDIDSNVGVMGSLKHLGLFAFIVLFLPALSVYLGNAAVSKGIVTYFVYQYIISIIENLGAIGFPLPDGIAEKFRRLSSEKYDVQIKSNGEREEETIEVEIEEKKGDKR